MNLKEKIAAANDQAHLYAHIHTFLDGCADCIDLGKIQTEAVTGSLEGLGLGSLTSGSSALGDIGADPAVFSADLINNIDVGQLIGAVAGS